MKIRIMVLPLMDAGDVKSGLKAAHSGRRSFVPRVTTIIPFGEDVF